MARSPVAAILIAESMLDHGVELHVILPLDDLEFLAQSVLPGGEAWVPRYRACIEKAASFSFASELEFFGDPSRYGYASRMAMGLAQLRARNLAGEAIQVAIWVGWPRRARPERART